MLRTPPAPVWLVACALAACGGDDPPVRVCDRLGLLCSDHSTVYNLGLSDSHSVSGDLDGDGRLDLVTAGGSAGLSIAWGGDSVRDYRLFPGAVTDAAIGDLDNDGDLDIAFVTREPAALHVLTGAGTRALKDGPSQDLAGHPQGLWLGRLDADDTLDAAVASADEGTLTVLTDGLTRARPIVFGRDLAAVDAGDLDGDGKLDLVAIDASDAAFHVLLAHGDDFAAPRRVATGLAPADLQLDDHDGDGKLDVLTHGKSPEIWFHAGDGAGGFAPARGLVVADPVHGFGAHRDDQGRRWLLTVDHAHMTAHQLDDADQVVGRIRSGGILGFSSLDMDAGAPLTRGSWYGQRFSLAPAHIFSERWYGGRPSDDRPILGDLDQDGIPELVASDDMNRVVVNHGLADGTWAGSVNLEFTRSTRPVAIADVTGDDLPDLVVADSSPALYVAIGAGDGSFTALGPPAAIAVYPASVHRGLARPGGGHSPVLVASGETDQPGIHAFRFDADGVASEEPQPLLTGHASQLAAADLDGDGGEDLVALIRSDDDSLSLLLLPTTADGWGPPRERPLADALPDLTRSGTALALGDLDLDERVDAVLMAHGQAARLLDIASDLPLAPQLDELDAEADQLAIADIDDDGRPDLAFCSSDGVFIAIADPDGALQAQPPFTTFAHHCTIHLDPTGVFAAIADDGGTAVLTPDFAPALVAEATFQGGPSVFERIATGDLDADGHTDIVVATAAAVPTSSFAVLWGHADGRPQRATWREGPLFAAAVITAAPFDARPGDELLAAYENGTIAVYHHAAGALEQTILTEILDLYQILAIGVQARADGPSDAIVLGEIDARQWGVVAVPQANDGEFVVASDLVVLASILKGQTDPALTIADFDADGFDDIVVFPGAGSPVQILWGDEQRRPGSAQLDVVYTSNALAAADMDGDGVPELVASGPNGATGYSLADRKLGEPTTYVKSSAAQGLLVADLEGDGHADLLRSTSPDLNVTLRDASGEEYVQLANTAFNPLRAAALDDDEILDLVGIVANRVVTHLSAPQETAAP